MSTPRNEVTSPATGKSVLVVEDEENLLAAIKYNLEREGYRALSATDGERGLTKASQERPDLLILDVMLPRLDGFEVCRLIRRESDVPILFLTARDQEMDRVVGLELGADDYVVKPFSMRELLARVKAMLRRPRSSRDERGEPPESIVSGDLEITLSSHTLTRGGEPVTLKPRAFELLALLMAHKGRVFTRGQILDRLWGMDFIGDARTVDVHVRWVREKIEDDAGKPSRIVTVRGVGYRFDG